MSPRIARRMVLASLLVILALPAGGAAFGYWSGSGSGAGSATTETALTLTLSPGTPAADLYPGGMTNVALTVSNPNASPLQVGSLALDVTQGTGGFAMDAGHSGCNVSTFTFNTDADSGAPWTIPGKVGGVNGTLSVTLNLALAMGDDAASACQGATTTVYLAAGP